MTIFNFNIMEYWQFSQNFLPFLLFLLYSSAPKLSLTSITCIVVSIQMFMFYFLYAAEHLLPWLFVGGDL